MLWQWQEKETAAEVSPVAMLLARATPPSKPTRDEAMRNASSFGARERICAALSGVSKNVHSALCQQCAGRKQDAQQLLLLSKSAAGLQWAACACLLCLAEEVWQSKSATNSIERMLLTCSGGKKRPSGRCFRHTLSSRETTSVLPKKQVLPHTVHSLQKR